MTVTRAFGRLEKDAEYETDGILEWVVECGRREDAISNDVRASQMHASLQKSHASDPESKTYK